MSKLVMSVSPHIRSKNTTQTIMLDVIIALCPALIAGIINFGWRSLLVTAFSALMCVILEYAYEKMMKMKVTVQDLSAIVTGMLIGLNVPASMPLWQILVADMAAILLAKMLFGGIGCNFMNPALVGRIVLMFSFATNMTTFDYVENGIDALSTATPLAVMSGLDWSSFNVLFLGNYGGVIGETSVLAILIGGLYLMARKVIKPIIPFTYLGSAMIFLFLFGDPHPILSLFAGGIMLGAFFMATDYVTSPFSNWGKVIFGVFIGMITALIRVFGNYAEGVTFAIILGNILVPYINELTIRKPFGAKKEEKKS